MAGKRGGGNSRLGRKARREKKQTELPPQPVLPPEEQAEIDHRVNFGYDRIGHD